MRERTIQLRVTETAHKIAKKKTKGHKDGYMVDWVSDLIIKAKQDMNEITIGIGVLFVLGAWLAFGIWLGEKYDFFALPMIIGIPLGLLFIVSLFF